MDQEMPFCFRTRDEIRRFASEFAFTFVLLGDVEQCRVAYQDLQKLLASDEAIVHSPLSNCELLSKEAPTNHPAVAALARDAGLVAYRDADETLAQFVEYVRHTQAEDNSSTTADDG